MSDYKERDRRVQDPYYACALSIVDSVIAAYDAQETVDLTKIRKDACKAHKLPKAPRIVDIIGAIPREYKSKVLPYIRSKPVRTASGLCVCVCHVIFLSFSSFSSLFMFKLNIIW